LRNVRAFVLAALLGLATVPTALAADPVLVGAGDIADCPEHPGADLTANLIDGIAGTVMAIGDTVQEIGTAAEFSDCYAPSWGRFLDRTRPAVGNHEYVTDNAQPYFDYFGAAADPQDRGGWYAYNLGSWRIYVLNSNCDKGIDCDAQLRWLKTALRTHPRDCIAAYWHHPMWSSFYKSSTYTMVHPFYKALYAANADVLINGHHHVYERFRPLKPDGTYSRKGIREFTVGTGGTSRMAVLREVQAGSVKYRMNTWGVLKLTLHPGAYDYQFIAAGSPTENVASGTVLDSGIGGC
jgi:hypothetical protein